MCSRSERYDERLGGRERSAKTENTQLSLVLRPARIQPIVENVRRKRSTLYSQVLVDTGGTEQYGSVRAVRRKPVGNYRERSTEAKYALLRVALRISLGAGDNEEWNRS